MMKYLYLIGALAFALGVSSCKKDEPQSSSTVQPSPSEKTKVLTSSHWSIEGTSEDGLETQLLALDFRPDGTYTVTYRKATGTARSLRAQTARAISWEVYSFSGNYNLVNDKLTILSIEYDRAEGVAADSPKIEEMKDFAQSLVGRVFRLNEEERTLTLTDEKPSPTAGEVTGPFRLFILRQISSTGSLKADLEQTRHKLDSLSILADIAWKEFYKADGESRRLSDKLTFAIQDSLSTEDASISYQKHMEALEFQEQLSKISNSLNRFYNKALEANHIFNNTEDEYNRLQSLSRVAPSANAFIGSWQFSDRYEEHTQSEDAASITPQQSPWTPFWFERFMDRLKCRFHAVGRSWFYIDERLGVELKELRINADGTGYADYKNSNPLLITDPGVEFRIPFTYRIHSDRSLEITTADVFGDLLTICSPSFLLTLMTDRQGKHRLRLSLIRMESTYYYNDKPEEILRWQVRDKSYFYNTMEIGPWNTLQLVGRSDLTITSTQYLDGYDRWSLNYYFQRKSK